MHRRRKWQPTPVFLPGESQGRGSLVGCRLWGCTESDMTEVTQHNIAQPIDKHMISKMSFTKPPYFTKDAKLSAPRQLESSRPCLRLNQQRQPRHQWPCPRHPRRLPVLISMKNSGTVRCKQTFQGLLEINGF